ncbi:hypothetical protein QAD02_015963 [Eretmocerus hayati]|uniref:Uncharacterized protein n=1 Tax=Eretmocerus hayati TaxID=131215 RepID=A0ACC2PB13_9HYME|nr:hypothetical protein QAD02_015963 [Eretmocerus hayati]
MNMIDDGLHGGDKKGCHDVWINGRQIRLDSDDETNTACPRRDNRQNKETLNGTPGTTDGSQTGWTLKHEGHVDAISSGKIIHEEMPANNKQTDELDLGNVETIRDLRRRNLLDSPKHLLEDCQLVHKISGDSSDLFNSRSVIDGSDATFKNQIDTRPDEDMEVFCKRNICGKCQDPFDVGKSEDLILFDGFCERCEDKMNSPMIEDIGGNSGLGYEKSNHGSNDDFSVNDRGNLYVEIENSDEYVVGKCDFIEPYTKEDELESVKRIRSPSAVRILRPQDTRVYNYENEIFNSYILLDLCGSLEHELEVLHVWKNKMARSGPVARVRNTKSPYPESKLKLGHIVSRPPHQFHRPRKKSRYLLMIKDTFSIIGKMQAPIRLHADVLVHEKSDVRVKRSVNDEQDGRGEARTPVITFEERDSHFKNINSTFSTDLKIKIRDNSAQNDKSLQTRPIRDDEKGENIVLDIDLLLCSRGLETELRRNRLITISETRGPQLMNIQNNDSCMRLKDDKNRYKTEGILFQGLMGYPSIKCNENFIRKLKNMAARAPRWDGVRPEEYPENYHDLLSYSCVTKHPGIEQYYVSYWTRILKCNQCYRNDHYSIAEPVGRVDTVHMIVPRNSIYCECERCGTRILVERPVIRCGMCSDQYFSNLILINVRQQREANAHLQAREINGDDSDIEVISESDKGSDSESGDQADPEDLSINP